MHAHLNVLFDADPLKLLGTDVSAVTIKNLKYKIELVNKQTLTSREHLRDQ